MWFCLKGDYMHSMTLFIDGQGHLWWRLKDVLRHLEPLKLFESIPCKRVQDIIPSEHHYYFNDTNLREEVVSDRDVLHVFRYYNEMLHWSLLKLFQEGRVKDRSYGPNLGFRPQSPYLEECHHEGELLKDVLQSLKAQAMQLYNTPLLEEQQDEPLSEDSGIEDQSEDWSTEDRESSIENLSENGTGEPADMEDETTITTVDGDIHINIYINKHKPPFGLGKKSLKIPWTFCNTMWFRLRLTPTHEFTAFYSKDGELYWDHVSVEKHYPDYRERGTYPLTSVGTLTSRSLHYRFTNQYLKRVVLTHPSFEDVLKDQDPTLYSKLIQLLFENQPITLLPGIQDNFSWEICLCVEPSATGDRTIQQFLREFKLHTLVFNAGMFNHAKEHSDVEDPMKYLKLGWRNSGLVKLMMETMARRKLAIEVYMEELRQLESEDGERDNNVSVEEKK